MEESIAPTIEQSYRPHFTGSAGEYFRIWIVNVFLTLITLGFYYAWAKVRTRRYFYTHTFLANHPFDYLANPHALLKGYLLIAGLLILYAVGTQLEPAISGMTLLAFYGLLPYVVYKSLCFRAYNSAYRNIRFHFHGSVQESYKIFLLWPLLIPLTLGLVFPYIVFRQRHFAFDNFAYGSTQNRFDGKPRKFYAVYVTAFVIIMLSYLVLFLLLFMGVSTSGGESMTPFTIGLFAVGYVALFAAILLIQQYTFAELFNYSWNQSTLGPVRFQSTLRSWALIWIRLSNVLAIIASLGLLIPWASVRRYRYIINRMTVITTSNLDDFTAHIGTDVSAIGEVAADFFDFDIGL